MHTGEFTVGERTEPSAMLSSDIAIDSHTNPLVVRILLQRPKMDTFGKGVHLYVGRTNNSVYPVASLLGYLAIHPAGVGPLFILPDSSLLTGEQFIWLGN